MQYLSIDIETTGLNPETCQVLEFAAVLDDLSNPQPIRGLPTFQRYVKHEIYRGEPYAIWLNAKYFEKRAKLGKGEPFDNWTTPNELLQEFHEWIGKIGYNPKKILVAGKNYKAFDEKFICQMNGYNERSWHHRSLDPAMYFVRPEDTEPPSTDVCLERAGLDKVSQHTALEDALDVVVLMRRGISLRN